MPNWRFANAGMPPASGKWRPIMAKTVNSGIATNAQSIHIQSASLPIMR